MIVVAIIGLLALMAMPSFYLARVNSQRSICMNNMRKIEAAKDQWAIEHDENTGVVITWTEVLPYLKTQPMCPAGGAYDGWEIGVPIYCTEHDWRGNPEYRGFIP